MEQLKGLWLPDASGGSALFGDATNINNTYYQYNVANGTAWCGNVGGKYNYNFTWDSNRHIYELNYEISNCYFKIDGTNLWTNTTTTAYPPQSDVNKITIFARKRYGAIDGQSKAIIYNIRFYNETTLISYLIPCYRKSDNEAGLYDCINNVFYTNQGSGYFTKGNNVYYKLPDSYEQLEYIESNGTQYIDTGVCATNTNDYDFTFQLRGYSGSWIAVIGGSKEYADGNWVHVGYGSGYRNLRLVNSKFAESAWFYYNDAKCNDYISKWKVNINKDGTFYINDVYVNTVGPSVFSSSPTTVTLFALNYGGTVKDKSSARMFYYKVFDNNVQIRHMIPAKRKVDNELGLYDMVNNKFYTNDGTGDFTAGPTTYDIMK